MLFSHVGVYIIVENRRAKQVVFHSGLQIRLFLKDFSGKVMVKVLQAIEIKILVNCTAFFRVASFIAVCSAIINSKGQFSEKLFIRLGFGFLHRCSQSNFQCPYVILLLV